MLVWRGILNRRNMFREKKKGGSLWVFREFSHGGCPFPPTSLPGCTPAAPQLWPWAHPRCHSRCCAFAFPLLAAIEGTCPRPGPHSRAPDPAAPLLCCCRSRSCVPVTTTPTVNIHEHCSRGAQPHPPQQPQWLSRPVVQDWFTKRKGEAPPSKERSRAQRVSSTQKDLTQTTLKRL